MNDDQFAQLEKKIVDLLTASFRELIGKINQTIKDFEHSLSNPGGK